MNKNNINPYSCGKLQVQLSKALNCNLITTEVKQFNAIDRMPCKHQT